MYILTVFLQIPVQNGKSFVIQNLLHCHIEIIIPNRYTDFAASISGILSAYQILECCHHNGFLLPIPLVKGNFFTGK